MKEILVNLDASQIFETMALKGPNMNNPWHSQG